MHIARPISHQRFTRPIAWMLAWLAWLGDHLEFWDAIRDYAHATLNLIARAIAAIILLRVGPRIRTPRRPRFVQHGPRSSWLQEGGKGGLMRALTRASLRSALRGNTIPARIAALLNVLRDLDAYVRIALRRLRIGLTRRRAIRARRVDERIRVFAAPRACSADTS
jgi:hypothetical protein